MAYTPGRAADVWPVLHRALGLTGAPALGAAVVLTPDGPPTIEGLVDVASDEFLGIRSASGLHRIGAEGDAGCDVSELASSPIQHSSAANAADERQRGGCVSAYHYFYGRPVDVAALTAQWQGWLEDLFPTKNREEVG
jgi:hypothetical protein